MVAWYNSLSAFQALMVWFIAFWVGALIWMKGSNPLANKFWIVLWFILKIALFICGGFILFALACCSKNDD